MRPCLARPHTLSFMQMHNYLSLHILALCLIFLGGLFPHPAWCQEESDGNAPWTPPAEAAKALAHLPWRMGELRFKGVKNLSLSTIRNVLEFARPPAGQNRQAPLFEPDQEKFHVKRLTQLYQEHGFFKAEVSSSLERNPLTRKVDIILDVKENKASKIRMVSLVFKNPKHQKRWEPMLRGALKIKKGQLFNLSGYKEAKAALGAVMSNNAHPLYILQGQARSYPEELAVDVVFQVDPGPRILFGKTLVSGNKKIDNKVILRELSYAVGQPFSLKQLAKSETALLDTGFFESVNFEPQFQDLKGDLAPVKLTVEERPAHSIRLRVGYGNEELFRLSLSQVNRNFLGLGDNLTVEGKISKIYEGLLVRWNLPYVPTGQTSLSMSAGRERWENEAFVYTNWLARPLLVSKYTGNWSWFLSYNLEQIMVTEVNVDVPDIDYEQQTFLISSFPIGMRYDSRDSVLGPTKGQFFQVQTEVSLASLGSDLDFIRPTAEYSIVIPWPGRPKWAWAAKLKGGAVFTLGSDQRVPLIRRFFPGGPDSVRGYPYQHLGPLDDSGRPLGGEVFAESNLELRFPLELAEDLKGLGGVLFFDLGNAWSSLSDDIFELRGTTGAGLRYETPVGPLRVDFGYQLNPPEGDFFDRWQVYLSLGQAF
jgi:outer membrane protein assembly complex protein YaeT